MDIRHIDFPEVIDPVKDTWIRIENGSLRLWVDDDEDEPFLVADIFDEIGFLEEIDPITSDYATFKTAVLDHLAARRPLEPIFATA